MVITPYFQAKRVGSELKSAALDQVRGWVRACHHITSHHITSHHIASHHIASHRIVSHVRIGVVTLIFNDVEEAEDWCAKMAMIANGLGSGQKTFHFRLAYGQWVAGRIGRAVAYDPGAASSTRLLEDGSFDAAPQLENHFEMNNMVTMCDFNTHCVFAVFVNYRDKTPNYKGGTTKNIISLDRCALPSSSSSSSSSSPGGGGVSGGSHGAASQTAGLMPPPPGSGPGSANAKLPPSVECSNALKDLAERFATDPAYQECRVLMLELRAAIWKLAGFNSKGEHYATLEPPPPAAANTTTTTTTTATVTTATIAAATAITLRCTSSWGWSKDSSALGRCALDTTVRGAAGREL